MDILDRRHFYQDKKCFNGAMPFQAWIYGLDEVTIIEALGLQWGHALSGMDIYPTAAEIVEDEIASMGPCLFRHGYRYIRELMKDMTA